MTKKLLFLMAIVLATSAAWAGESVDVTKSASATPTVAIENLAGSVKVTGWNRDEIKVSGVLGDDTDGLDFSGSNDNFDIEVEILIATAGVIATSTRTSRSGCRPVVPSILRRSVPASASPGSTVGWSWSPSVERSPSMAHPPVPTWRP